MDRVQRRAKDKAHAGSGQGVPQAAVVTKGDGRQDA
jgi:hypothetical protein